MYGKEKHLIRFDWAIKKLLRNKANFGILESFLSELLSKDLEEYDKGMDTKESEAVLGMNDVGIPKK